MTAVPIGTIETHVGDRYIVRERRGAGASGVVYRACSADDEQLVVAVKFYLIPSQAMLWGTTAQAFWDSGTDEQAYLTERSALRELNHPGIQHVLGWGKVADAGAKFSAEVDFGVPRSNEVGFLVSRYVEGHSITEWLGKLNEEAVSATSPKRYEVRTRIVNALIDLLEALTYLHQDKFHQHSDIRPENILIEAASQRPVLIDFGYSQAFGDALLKTTPKTRVRPLRLLNAPAELEVELQKLSVHGQPEVSREALRKLLFPGLDLYQFGKLLCALLDGSHLGGLVTPLDQKFLSLIAGELSSWSTARFTKTGELLAQLRKLADGYWAAAAAPHAPQLAPGQPVRRIALAESAFLAPRFVERIIETDAFRRLQQLKQLSLLDFVYPSATQTRLDHSLAVYSTAVELVQSLVRSPRFTKLFDTTAVNELLVCALLHDVNHFPFLHYCQELSLASKDPLNLFELFIEGDKTSAAGASPSIADVVSDEGLQSTTIVNLLSSSYGELTDPRHQVIKSVLDSGVDIDKLCYVQGDARATGVPFGAGVDRGKLLSAADVLLQPRELGGTDHHWHLCFEPPALSAVESLLLARYWNFRQIYWHHTNRALGAMVSHVLRRLNETGNLDLRSYASSTMSQTEAAALRHLDELHQQKLGNPSILRDLVTRRAGIFKRLLSIRAPWTAPGPRTADEERRPQLVELLKKVPEGKRSTVLEQFSAKLPDVLTSLKGADDGVAKPLVLLDIPGRPLDEEMGQVFVAKVALNGEAEHVVQSPFIETLQKEFLNLSRTVRFFIPAATRDLVGKEAILKAQVELEKLLLAVLQSNGIGTKATTR